MIELANVGKRFKDRYVLKNINLRFPRVGLVIINGPSGSGKTTLLNVVSSLLDFEGDISFEGKHFSHLSKTELDNLRNKKIGFVFQDYKLFEFETVRKNILLSIDLGSSDKEKKKLKRVKDLLVTVGLAHKENELVSNLSGGEKQRVAIARALANGPSVLLADEPTGNLDEKNTESMMELLVKIATSSLVIMVSHDLEITNKYADEIIKMKDGQIVDHKYISRNKHNERLPVIKLKYRDKKARLPSNFLFGHTLNSIKRRRWRTLFVTSAISLGLIGVGLASTLREIISTNMLTSYSSIFDSDKLVVSNKSINTSKDLVTSVSFDEVLTLKEDNPNINGYGVYYWNIKDMFPTENYLLVDNGGVKRPIGEFTANDVNEFALLSTYKGDVYPHKIEELQNDEIVLSMPMLVISELCYQLQITRTIESLSNYIEHHEVNLNYVFSNSSWDYSIEIPLKLKGFILSSNNLIYHTNTLWNEYIFEEVGHLSTTQIINSNSSHPWDLKKVYYLTFSSGRDEFISNHRFDISSMDLDFEILDKKYYPILFKDTETYFCNRLAVLHRSNKDDIPSYIGEYCKKTSKSIIDVIYGSSNGYSIYEQSLMMGFSRSTYLSKDKDSLLYTVDELSYISYEDSLNVITPNNIIEGHFSKSQMDGFVFESSYTLLAGRAPINYQEIVISESLRNRLGISNPINSTIHLSFPIVENLLPNGFISREYRTVDLKVVGISNSGKLSISHLESWSILFFQIMLGISTFDLRINNLAIKVNSGDEELVIDKINRAFPFLNVTAPLKEAKDSVDRICDYIEIIMLTVSITSVVIASLILLLCNYLHYVEIKKDIGLVRCLGVREKESRKFVYFHSLFMTGLALLLSIFELVVISFVLSKVMADTLYIQETFILNPMSILYMTGVALFISLLSTLLISKKISKLDPLECLR